MWGPQEEKNSVQGKRRKKASVKQAHVCRHDETDVLQTGQEGIAWRWANMPSGGSPVWMERV